MKNKIRGGKMTWLEGKLDQRKRKMKQTGKLCSKRGLGEIGMDDEN